MFQAVYLLGNYVVSLLCFSKPCLFFFIPVAQFCVDNFILLLVSFILLLNAMDLILVPVHVSVADQESVTTLRLSNSAH